MRDGLTRGSVGGAAAAWIRRGPDGDLPIVVLHGAGLDRAGASWCRVLPRLAEANPVYAPDLPGHGNTAPLRSFHGVPDIADWLLRFLDTVGIDRAILTGVSMGGAVSLQVALDAPDRVAAAIPVASYGISRRLPLHPIVHAGTRLPLARLTDPLVARSRTAAWIALRTIITDPGTISPDIVAELCEIARSTTSEAAFDRFLGAEIGPRGFRTTLLDRLPRLRVPVHFVHGTHDVSIPITAAREAARLAGAPLTEVEAGHWPMYERPEAYLAVAERVIGGCHEGSIIANRAEPSQE